MVLFQCQTTIDSIPKPKKMRKIQITYFRGKFAISGREENTHLFSFSTQSKQEFEAFR